jgi:hypothetical protein
MQIDAKVPKKMQFVLIPSPIVGEGRVRKILYL